MYKSNSINRNEKSEFKKRVVIIGANFAGLATSMRLSNNYLVTVIDPSPYFEFLPNIHELVSAVKQPEHLRLSRRRLLHRAGHRFFQDTVTVIDPAQSVVLTQSGERFSFDICVVAVGGVNNTFGIQGADAFSLPFKSVHDCEAIGDKLRYTVACQEKVSVVIVGGGLEGIEALGEILRRYRTLAGLTIHVVERNARLLPDEPEVLDREIRHICQAYPVSFHTGTSVTGLTKTAVQLSSADILPADVTIWTVGATAPQLLMDAGLAQQAGGWAPVHHTLQSVYFDNIFVAGDAAELPQPISKQGSYAIDMGECVADNIVRSFSGQPLKTFQASSLPALISFGDLDTFLVFGNTVIAGAVLAAAKEGVYQLNMAQFDPPWHPTAFCHLQERSWQGLMELVIPTLTSPFALLRLTNLRLLSC